MTIVALRSAQAGAFLTALGLSAGLMTGVAQADPPREHSCPSPFFSNSNLNERYGVSERIIGPPDCREAFVGEQWVRAVPPWVTATPALQADFKSKFVSARYLIDAGTAQEQTITAKILKEGLIPDNSPKTPWDGLSFIVPLSPVLHPLPPGRHTVNVFVTMSGETCNGLKDAGKPPAPGLDPQIPCLPGGPGGRRIPVASHRQQHRDQPPGRQCGRPGFHSFVAADASDADEAPVIPGLGVRVIDRTRHRPMTSCPCRCRVTPVSVAAVT